MPYKAFKQGSQWCVFSLHPDGSKKNKQACHDSKDKAQKQAQALNIHANSAGRATMNDGATSREGRELFRSFYGAISTNGEEAPAHAALLRADGGEGDDDGTMVGHFSVFDQWTEINSFFEGNFMERFVKGAYKKTFRENRQKMKVLFQHGRDMMVGDKPLGPIETLREDDHGAYYEVPLLRDEDGNLVDYVRAIAAGLRSGLYGASFRFKVVKEEVDEEPERSEHNPNGIPERTVREAHVMEFGPVTFPAYQGASAGIRSETDRFLFLRMAEDPDSVRAFSEALVLNPVLVDSLRAAVLPDGQPAENGGDEGRQQQDSTAGPDGVAAPEELEHSPGGSSGREPLYGMQKRGRRGRPDYIL